MSISRSNRPSDANNPRSRPSAPPLVAQPNDEVFDLYLRQDDEDRRSLRVSLIVAALVHLVLLGVTLPALSGPAIEPPEERKVVRLTETPRFKKEPPPPPEAPKQQARSIPMPDETPHEPELIVPDVVEPPIVPTNVDDLPFDLPVAPPEPEPTGPVMVGEVNAPTRIHYVKPEYTEPARRARVQGIVFLQATIDERGRVVDLEVIKGQPLGLTESARDAVSKWRYEPSALNGKPVSVLMTVAVHFELN